MKRVRRWIVNALLLPFDYFVAGIFWMRPGITISSRCGMAVLSGEPGWKGDAMRKLASWLDKIDPDHCVNAIDGDIGRLRKSLTVLERWDLTDEAGA